MHKKVHKIWVFILILFIFAEIFNGLIGTGFEETNYLSIIALTQTLTSHTINFLPNIAYTYKLTINLPTLPSKREILDACHAGTLNLPPPEQV